MVIAQDNKQKKATGTNKMRVDYFSHDFTSYYHLIITIQPSLPRPPPHYLSTPIMRRDSGRRRLFEETFATYTYFKMEQKSYEVEIIFTASTMLTRNRNQEVKSAGVSWRTRQ